jgi:biopolymer transport protein TolR
MKVGSHRRRRSALSEINVTPLVDVMLVLLIIFMITAPALLQELTVSLPKSTVGQAEVAEGVVITLTQDGMVEIDREKVPYADLRPRLAAALALKGDRPIFLRADEQIPYGKVVAAVGQIKEAGVDRVGLVVEIVSSAPPRR